ncbi:MAG: type II toxin-antitoxin system VapC family toxin [Elusimicrobia bacterium]|nr:type II toxin-antitoxin system VapC family toxin [Elusimicrobiota bacterium]
MILIDSSGWIEFFTNGSKCEKFYSYLKDLKNVVTPTIVLYEVYKKMKRDISEQHALEAVAQMLKTQVVPVSEEIALSAADISLEYNLAMADSIVYATALEHNCKVMTMDHDFAKCSKAEVVK